MIFYWLIQLWRSLRWLFTPPAARDVARVDANSPCPACGARDGELMCVTPPEGVIVRHTCHQCGARWHEPAVTKTDASRVWASKDSEFLAVPLLPRSGRAT